MAQKAPIVGSIIERKAIPPSSTPKAIISTKTGFPTVQHRSKSAFARNREDLRKPRGASRLRDVPAILPSSRPAQPPSTEPDNWREQISKENEERVAAMDKEELEEERRQILERFGASISDVLKRARFARKRQREAGKVPQSAEDEVPVTSEERKPPERARSPPPSALVSPSSTRPSSRLDRQLRFAELEPDDVHVYESAPSSPKRRVLALPPPDPASDGQTISLGQWKGRMVPQDAEQPEQSEPQAQGNNEPKEPEEGTTEYIRQRFFPDAPKDDPNLAWMENKPSSDSTDSTSSSLRFDLNGIPIPTSVSLTLPTHLGLHHHAEGTHAGYTLDDIFLLSRSTVPAQRATMLGILARIANRIGHMKRGETFGMEEVIGKEEELRKRILAGGIEAMSERGSVGARAIDVVWECIVGWNQEMTNLEGVELDSPLDVAINTLPWEFFLLQIATILTRGDALPESGLQLLSILHRLAQQSNAIADHIVSTPKLLPAVLQTFLLTPIPPQDSSPLPNSLALQLFYTLTLSSRSNAQQIEKLADSLLRFVTFLPISSPYSPPLATNLLISTLRVYSVLASYGLYSHIAGTAVTQLAHLEQYVISEACTSYPLKTAWANLIEDWIICAIDPHQTTPTHDILWSQIVGWSWNSGIAELETHLKIDEKEWMTWTASWRAQAAWLEGSKVNAIKGGEQERSNFIDSVKLSFEGGKAFEIVTTVLDMFQKGLLHYKSGEVEQIRAISGYASVLSAVIRLWLACLPPHLEGTAHSPPFVLPFSRLSELSANLLVHPLWSLMTSPDTSFGFLYCRDISEFLSYYLRVSMHLPGVSESLWMAQAFSILLRLGPGDESAAESVVRVVAKLITPEWAVARNIQVSSFIWERGGLSVLEPFLANKIRPQEDIFIGPLMATPQSIRSATTQRLPAPSALQKSGLPLFRDWAMSPLDHLLRSGDSVVFNSLPTSWDFSEVEVTRASLFLTKVIQETLMNFSLTSFIPTREEAIFGCMKIFMLEHGQPQNDSSEEVFRDGVVEHLMEDILRRYTLGSDAQPTSTKQEDLEKVASRFLSPSVPFFQFYTDFVALYDAISFSHPLFAKLLLPPISMYYARDYRRHLWCDFNHVVRTIRTSPDQILSSDVREYLYPVEIDGQILGSYLSSLLRGELREFMRFVALHHVACNIWPDLQGSDIAGEDKGGTLLKVILEQGSNDLVRDVVRYHQTASGKLLLLPSYHEGLNEEARVSRIDYLTRLGGQDLADRLQVLLKV